MAAYTNGRSVVSEFDALLLQYIIWSRPEDQVRVYDFLLARMAADSDLKQANYLLSSLFGRTCHSLDVRSSRRLCLPLFSLSPHLALPRLL